MKHLGPLERKRRDTAVPLAAVECGPGVPAPLSQISMSRGLGNVMKEARLVTELQTCHQPGGLQSHRAQAAPPNGPYGVAGPWGLLSPFSGEILARVFSSLVFMIFLKTDRGSSCFQVEAPLGSSSQSAQQF